MFDVTNAIDIIILDIRDKDFLKCIIKPEPTYWGDTIPVSGNGDATNDKKGDFWSRSKSHLFSVDNKM